MNGLIVFVSLLFAILGLIALFVNYATNTMSELRYMLREAQKRQKIFLDSTKIPGAERERLLAASAEEIDWLENRINSFWAKKFARPEGYGIFDNL